MYWITIDLHGNKFTVNDTYFLEYKSTTFVTPVNIGILPVQNTYEIIWTAN